MTDAQKHRRLIRIIRRATRELAPVVDEDDLSDHLSMRGAVGARWVASQRGILTRGYDPARWRRR